jgi:archaellum biogenesis ATPase FlaH
LINYISHPDVLKQNGLDPESYIFVAIDLEGLGELTQSEFFRMIILELRHKLTDGHLRNRTAELLQNEDIRFLSLKEILEDISELGKNVIFLFDEFELITNNNNLDSNFFSGLRNLANSHNVGYITASKVQLLELTLSQETLGSPFFNFFTQVDLGFLSDDAAVQLISSLAKEHGKTFPGEIVEFIKQTAGSHPFFIQLLCFITFNLMIEKGTISKDDTTEIHDLYLEEVRPHFQYFWNHISVNEQKILTQLSKHGPGELSQEDKDTIRSLKRNTLITDLGNAYKVFSEGFSEFVANDTSMSISPIGKNDLDQGHGTPVGPMASASITQSEITSQPTPEQNRLTIKWGTNYFVNEKEPGTSVDFFKSLHALKLPSLFITRTPPDKAQDKWKLENSNIIWLCTTSGANYLRPVLEKISHTIFEFVSQHEHSIVLLDGVEFIVNNNDFLKTLNLLDSIKETIAIKNSILILPISSSIFTEREMALLSKNSIEVSGLAQLDYSILKK